jgi:hypothetical protein
MKKTTMAALAFLASAAVFADGFKLSGYLRAGYSSTFGDHATQTTQTWLAGDYWGGKTRSRININWDNADETAGAFFRLQYTGAIEDITLSDTAIKYADAYAKVLDKKAVVVAGKLFDNLITSDGWEGFSVIDGKSGFFAGLTPVEGLTVGGGAVLDYKGKESVTTVTKVPVYDSTGTATNYYTETTTTSSGDSYTDKNAAVAGFKYVNNAVTVDGGYSGIGAAYGNINITAVKNLLVALEYAYESDDAADDHSDVWYDCENTFCEQVEYTGIDKLTLAMESYQFLNNHSITDDSNTTITITPAISYAINKTFAVSVEGTYTMYDYDGSDDNFGFVVPALKISADDTTAAYIWAQFSTDQDATIIATGTSARNCMGVGVKKTL